MDALAFNFDLTQPMPESKSRARPGKSFNSFEFAGWATHPGSITSAGRDMPAISKEYPVLRIEWQSHFRPAIQVS